MEFWFYFLLRNSFDSNSDFKEWRWMNSTAFKKVVNYYVWSCFIQVITQMKCISVCAKLFFKKLQKSSCLPMHYCFYSWFDFISAWVLEGNSEITNLFNKIAVRLNLYLKSLLGISWIFFSFYVHKGVLALLDVKSIICKRC